MTTRLGISRRAFLGAGSATASAAVLFRPASAAQFEYKLAHPLGTETPIHRALSGFCDAVRTETNGRLAITVFPNGVLASQDKIVNQVQLGAVQLMSYGSSAYSGIVPVVEIDSVGFTFTSSPQAWRVMDGSLGEFVRRQFSDRWIFAFPKKFESGMRQITTSTKAVKTLGDLAGLKLEVPIAKLSVDFFKALGAAPDPIPSSAWFTSLQTHVVDGCDTPIVTIETFKLYEVVKFVSITNHMWNGMWMVANGDAWSALPSDIQRIVLQNQAKYADLERKDAVADDNARIERLRARGIAFNTTDTAPMRSRMSDYYASWKGTFGTTAWGLLEAGVGKLA